MIDDRNVIVERSTPLVFERRHVRCGTGSGRTGAAGNMMMFHHHRHHYQEYRDQLLFVANVTNRGFPMMLGMS